MADVISEEIELGSTNLGSGVEETPVGQSVVQAKPAPVNTPASVSLDTESVLIPSTKATIAKEYAAAPLGSATLDDLNKVYDKLVVGCATASALATELGLDYQVVLTCLNWLVGKKIVARNNKIFCGIDTINSMQAQLIACKGCVK